MIVGTAGHIDHGKTTLVRALTGVDTDRLKEERERGISIELGYAYVPLPDGEVLGYIDVPGHERLIHTMAAGASGIDLALLVVAADDGVMPQTREHVAILDLLGVTRAVVALTKVDRADAGRLDAVRGEIEGLLAPTPFAGASVFPVNATRDGDPGVTALRDHLHAAAHEQARRARDGLFRLAVDRVFTLAGHGTVVTGTVFGGSVHTGDFMHLAPKGEPVRVRSIHAQQRAAQASEAGQRCALNLAGIDKDAIRRGDWIVDPRLDAPTQRVDVSLTLLADADVQLKHWSPVHVHLGTTHQLANVVLLDAESLEAGSGALAQLVFATPVCALPGDRFIVRNAQATRTVGGGTVLDPFAPERRRRTPQRLAWLAAMQSWIAGHGLDAMLAQAPRGIPVSRLVVLTGRAPDQWQLPADALTVAPPQHADATVMLARHWHALQRTVLDALATFHARQPDEPGPGAGTLRRIIFSASPVPDGVWAALLDTLAAQGDVRREGPWLQLPSHALTLSDEERRLAERVLPLLAGGGFDPPWTRELAATLGLPEERMRQLLRKLARGGTLHQVVRDLFYDAARIADAAALVATLVREHGSMDAVQFRDGIGIGRKRAIQLLEFFDRVGYTRRVGNARVLRPDAHWQVTKVASPATAVEGGQP